MKLIDRWLKLERINGAGSGPVYLYRWILLRTPWFAIYLHHFVGDDWSRDMHDHPKSFTSIGLWGGYIEETPSGSRTFRAPWFRRFAPEHLHRIRLRPGGSAWTLAIVGRQVRQWGFVRDGAWIHWKEYVYGRRVPAVTEAPNAPEEAV